MTGPVAPEGHNSVVRRLRRDVGSRPFLVLMELTRACALACRHCRADAVEDPDPDEMDSAQVRAVLDDLADLGPPRPLVVFTGGDPLRRGDLDELIDHGAHAGLAVALSPAGTPLASPERLDALARAGAGAVSFSLDGASATAHDTFRGVRGSFGWTMAGAEAARVVGLRLQINTAVCADTVGELPGILRLVSELGAGLWSVFFVVATGRASNLRPLHAEQVEDVLQWLVDAADVVPLKTTEAPQYRRVLLERQRSVRAPRLGPLYSQLHTAALPAPRARPRRPPLALGDGRGVVFVSHRGEVYPSGFLPLVAGQVRQAPLSAIYTGSALMTSLRDPSRLGGRCGVCEFKELCGGSRAQAFARYGDPLAEDPTCAYRPGEWAHHDGPALPL